jgi:hypothetical protein
VGSCFRICFSFFQALQLWPAINIGFAASLAGLWFNQRFIAIVLHLGLTNIFELLLVTFTFISLFSIGTGLDQQ